MSIQIKCISLSTRPDADELALLDGMLEDRGRVTLVVPSFGVRDVCRRALADAGHGVGLEVTTADGWIQMLWELAGDGRRLVCGAERRLLMAQAVADVLEGVSASGACDGPVHAGASGGRSGLSNTSGTIKMLVQAAREYLPYLVRAGQGAGLSASEGELVRALRRYARLLQDHGLVEGAEAAVALAASLRERPLACAGAVVFRGIHRMPEYLLELMEAVSRGGDVAVLLEEEAHGAASALCRRMGCDEAPAEPARGHASPSGVRCAEVCGPAARDASYAQMIAAAVRAARGDAPASPGPVVEVAAPDQLGLFRALASRLAAQGIPSAVEARVPFGATRAGQALVMLSDLLARVEGEEPSAWWPAPEVPDWIRSPFSGLSSHAPRIARMLDTRLRKTRSLTGRALMDELESLQSREVNRERERADRDGRERRPVAVKAVLDALQAGHGARALQLMSACASAAPAPAFGAEGAAAKQAELAALDAAQGFMDEARRLGVAEQQALLVLPELVVRYDMQVAPRAAADPCEPAPAAPLVAFRALDALASTAPRSCAAAMLLDADAASYPLVERDTPVTVLARKLGCSGIEASPTERQRATFRHALESGRVGLLSYVARDRQAEECYPALTYAEYRASAQESGAGTRAPLDMGDTSRESEASRVLAALDRAVDSLPTEGALARNLDPAGGEGARPMTAVAVDEHAVAADLAPLLLLPERSMGSRVVPRTLSASQIENYLSCPYRWLVSNRASTRRLDVEFSPIEMGNFVHDVMQRFHERLIEAGLMRVRPETVGACIEQMDRAFDEVRSDHARGKYTHGKYAREERPRAIRGALVPLDELERNRLDAMLPKLHEVVRYEADMLSIFTPAQFEYSFDKEGVTYAGRPLGGRIDRIDTAPDAGSGERFVVIDYKNRASVRDLGCADPTMMLEEGERLAEAWLPGRDADRAPKVQTLIYAQALERVGGGSAQGAVYFATRGPQVAGAVADALVASEPPAFPHDAVSGYPGVKPPRSRTAKHDGTLGFQEMLDAVEAGVARELDLLERGAIAPRPASDSCSFCPLTMCERRRS